MLLTVVGPALYTRFCNGILALVAREVATLT